jgi:hypothetical protein
MLRHRRDLAAPEGRFRESGTGATLAAAVAPVPLPADRPVPGEETPAEAAVERRSVVERIVAGSGRPFVAT